MGHRRAPIAWCAEQQGVERRCACARRLLAVNRSPAMHRRFRLPCMGTPAAAQFNTATMSTEKPYLLVVEDEATQRQILSEYLSRQGLRVAAVSNGALN